MPSFETDKIKTLPAKRKSNWMRDRNEELDLGRTMKVKRQSTIFEEGKEEPKSIPVQRWESE